MIELYSNAKKTSRQASNNPLSQKLLSRDGLPTLVRDSMSLITCNPWWPSRGVKSFVGNLIRVFSKFSNILTNTVVRRGT